MILAFIGGAALFLGVTYFVVRWVLDINFPPSSGKISHKKGLQKSIKDWGS